MRTPPPRARWPASRRCRASIRASPRWCRWSTRPPSRFARRRANCRAISKPSTSTRRARKKSRRRLAAIEELSRKHRVTSARARRARHAARERTRRTRQRRQQSQCAQEAAGRGARGLSQARDAVIRRRARPRRAPSSKDITARMQTLGMAGGRFLIDITPAQRRARRRNGFDAVEFRVTANPGQPLRPLAKVASGGELSRLSLAVQVACSAKDARCMVFDEVDSGVGGAVAEIVGPRAQGAGLLGPGHLRHAPARRWRARDITSCASPSSPTARPRAPRFPS